MGDAQDDDEKDRLYTSYSPWRFGEHPNSTHNFECLLLTHVQGYNLSEGKWKWNDAPRNGGRYLWRQVYNVRRHNVRTIYGAMWDE